MSRAGRNRPPAGQLTLDECFLAKFKYPTPKKMPPLRATSVNSNDNDNNTNNNNTNNNINKVGLGNDVVLTGCEEEDPDVIIARPQKRPSTPPESPFKRRRVANRRKILDNDDDDDDDDNNNKKKYIKSSNHNHDGDQQRGVENREPSESPASSPEKKNKTKESRIRRTTTMTTMTMTTTTTPQSSPEKKEKKKGVSSSSASSSPEKKGTKTMSPLKSAAAAKKGSSATPDDGDDDDDDDDESSSDDDDDDDVEALRRRNIEDNHRFLAELGIVQTKELLFQGAGGAAAGAAKRRSVKGVKPKARSPPPEPQTRRVSLRQRKIDSDGVALAPDYKEPSARDIRRGLATATPVVFGAGGSAGSAGAREAGRKPTSTPLPFSSLLSNNNDVKGELEEDDLTAVGMGADRETFLEELRARNERKEQRRKDRNDEFIAGLLGCVRRGGGGGGGGAEEKSSMTAEAEDRVGGKTEAGFLREMKKLKCGEALERKVTRERIFGMAIHPCPSKTLIAVGDKWGGVGLWDVDNPAGGEDGVYLFHPHANPINVLRWAPEDSTAPTDLFTCSYDGTIRRGDFQKEVFECVFAALEEDDVALSAFAFTSPHTMLASDLRGDISFIDTRVEGLGAVATYHVHPKSCRSVDVHPLDKHYFVTAGTEGNAFIWDARKMSSKHVSPVATMRQARTVNSAYFSPVTGNRVLTTGMDDFYRVFDFSEKKSQPAMIKDLRHNNNTGRWLTKFRAVWYPRREDLILSGLMGHPRQIEIYSAASTKTPKKLEKVHELVDADVLGSICCVIQGHPYKPLVAGGNASGKVYVFR